MQNNQASSHRPKREDQKSKELSDLKRENFQLRRTIKQLQKEIKKRVKVEEDVAEQGLEEQAPEEFEAPQEPVQDELGCPECQTPVRVITLAGKDFLVCPECKWRKKAA